MMDDDTDGLDDEDKREKGRVEEMIDRGDWTKVDRDEIELGRIGLVVVGANRLRIRVLGNLILGPANGVELK